MRSNPRLPTRRAHGGVLVLAGALLLGGCDLFGPGDGTIRSYEIAPYKATCYSLFAELCLQARTSSTAPFTSMFEVPDGFTFEWGFAYLIFVNEYDIEDPPLDGPSIRRELREVVTKVSAPAGTVELAIEPAALQATDPDTWSVYSGPEEIACPSDCALFREAVDSGARINVTVAFPAPASGVFPVVSWIECSEASGWTCTPATPVASAAERQ